MSEKEENLDNLSDGEAREVSADQPLGVPGDLPPELKSIEAELALLSPRTDRLNRDRLIFLAGQASVDADKAPTRRARRWPWQAAFAAMTTVAAALAATLLLQGSPEAEIRIVEVPVERPGSDGSVAENGPEVPRPDDFPAEPSPAPREIDPQADSPSGLWAAVGLDRLRFYDAGRLRREASYPRLRDQVLAEGLDSWALPESAHAPESEVPPVPYRKWRDQLLEDQARTEPASGRPTLDLPFRSGASS